jgi:hypothetical protein
MVLFLRVLFERYGPGAYGNAGRGDRINLGAPGDVPAKNEAVA